MAASETAEGTERAEPGRDRSKKGVAVDANYYWLRMTNSLSVHMKQGRSGVAGIYTKFNCTIKSFNATDAELIIADVMAGYAAM